MDYRNRAIILILLCAAFRILYIVFTPFDLSPDEAHYWEWSRRLGLSYYSKGPLVAYVIALFTKVFGTNDLGVRFGSVFFSSLASYLMYLVGRDLFGSPRVGFYSAVLANITPIFAIGSILMTTDVLLIFFWVSAVLCVKRALDSGGLFIRRRGGWWLAAALLIGLGFLGKYTMALFYPCVGLFLIFSYRDRFWLGRAEPYIAGLVSLVVASPVFIWNITHGNVTFKHTVGQTHFGSASFSFADMLEFLGSQVGFLTPLIFIGMVYGAWKAAATGFKGERTGPMLAFFTSVPIFLFFLLKGFHGKVQANWAVAAYVTALPAAVWGFSLKYRATIRPAVKKSMGWVGVVTIIMAVAVSAAAYFPWVLEYVGVKGVLDRPPYNRVTGWAELGRKVSDIRDSMVRPHETFIMSDTYQITSELAFYVRGNPIAYNINTGSRRMNQYDLWPGFDGLVGKDALYVKGGNAVLEPMVEAAFTGCEKDVLGLYMGERYLKDFTVFKCRGFKGLENELQNDIRY